MPCSEPPDFGSGSEAEKDEGQRLVALLGIPRGPGTVVMMGRPARFAA